MCKGVSPLPSAEVALFEPAEALRTCIERALGAYVREMYPAGAHLTVYGTATGEAGKGQLKVVACYGAKSAALGNFYAGGLCARWQVLVSPGEGAEVCGGVRARVHYFEEGNVQLNLSRSWQHALDAADGDEQLAEALVELVRSSEGDWHERLLDAFADLGEHALKVGAWCSDLWTCTHPLAPCEAADQNQHPVRRPLPFAGASTAAADDEDKVRLGSRRTARARGPAGERQDLKS